LDLIFIYCIVSRYIMWEVDSALSAMIAVTEL
jgi:hypothetical protein